jgi:hypothetical protein
MLWFNTTIQATVFDANNFCHRISQLTQLTSGNIPHPVRFDQMIHIEQREESLQHIVSGIYDPNAILQNLSEHDIFFDSNLKESIDRERNAIDLFDLRDSKGEMQSICSQEGLPIDHDLLLARNVLN